MKKYPLTLTFLLVCTLLSYGQLPNVSLKTLEGKTINAKTLSNDGKPFIISFFATWCKPCHRELKAINEVYEDWREETGVRVFAVSIDEAQNVAQVKPLVDRLEWDFDILLDTNSDFKRALGINTIPATLIVDGDGQIVATHTGYTDGSEENLIEEVRKLTKTK